MSTSTRAPVPNREPIAKTLDNNSKVFSIFVDNLPKDLGIILPSLRICLVVFERFWMRTFQTNLEEKLVESMLLSDLLTFKRARKLLIIRTVELSVITSCMLFG